MTQVPPEKATPDDAPTASSADESVPAAGSEQPVVEVAAPEEEPVSSSPSVEPANAPPADVPATGEAPSVASAPAPVAGEAAGAADEPAKAESDFGKQLEAFEGGKKKPARKKKTGPRVGDKVGGTVVSISDTHLMVDIGGRSEATAEIAPFKNEDGTLKVAVGDKVELFIVEAGEQIALAPTAKAEKHAGIERMREAHASGMPVNGRVTGTNTGGLQVNLGSVRGFCPLSQIELGRCEDPSSYVGKKLDFIVTAVEASRRSVVLSRRRLLRREEAETAKTRLAELKPGDELEGTVRRIEPFGVFVNLGGLDGMVHVSEIQHGRVAHPRDVIKEGEKVRVRVIRIEKGKGGRPRIGLSIKAAIPDPWLEVPNQFSAGMRVKGVVARRVEFGLFVTLAPGVDGLVHVSELAGTGDAQGPAAGEEIEVTVRLVDSEKRRISLTTREPGAEMEAGPRPARRGRERSEREPRGGGGGRDREPKGGGRRQRPPRTHQILPPRTDPEDAPLTTMAIALRKAVEREKAKQKRKRSDSDED